MKKKEKLLKKRKYKKPEYEIKEKKIHLEEREEIQDEEYEKALEEYEKQKQLKKDKDIIKYISEEREEEEKYYQSIQEYRYILEVTDKNNAKMHVLLPRDDDDFNNQINEITNDITNLYYIKTLQRIKQTWTPEEQIPKVYLNNNVFVCEPELIYNYLQLHNEYTISVVELIMHHHLKNIYYNDKTPEEIRNNINFEKFIKINRVHNGITNILFPRIAIMPNSYMLNIKNNLDIFTAQRSDYIIVNNADSELLKIKKGISKVFSKKNKQIHYEQFMDNNYHINMLGGDNQAYFFILDGDNEEDKKLSAYKEIIEPNIDMNTYGNIVINKLMKPYINKVIMEQNAQESYNSIRIDFKVQMKKRSYEIMLDEFHTTGYIITIKLLLIIKTNIIRFILDVGNTSIQGTYDKIGTTRRIITENLKNIVQSSLDIISDEIYKYLMDYIIFRDRDIDIMNIQRVSIYGIYNNLGFYTKVLALRPNFNNKSKLLIQTHRDVTPCLFRILLIISGYDEISTFLNKYDLMNDKKWQIEMLTGSVIYCMKFIKEQMCKKVDLYFVKTHRYIDNGAKNEKDGKIIYLYNKHAEISNIGNFNKIIKYRTFKLAKNKVRQIKYEDWYLDIETIQIGEELFPYLLVIVNDKGKFVFWGKKCVYDFILYLQETINERKYVEYEEEKYININIWSFNGSRFDYIYVFKEILELDPTKIILGGTKTNIKYMEYNRVYKFYDLKLITTRGSLNNTLKSFGITSQKIDFDIKNKNDKWFEDNKDNIVKYCIHDCVVLKELKDKVFKMVVDFSEIEINNAYSIATLAKEIYKAKYLGNNVLIGDTKDIYDKVRDAYYGGITFNTKFKVNNANYYDINSSYPNVMQYNVPFKYVKTYKCQIDKNKLWDCNLYKVKGKFRKIPIPYMPTRTKFGLIYTLEFEGYRWGVELKLGINKNLFEYISIEECIIFEEKPIFKEFITDIYNKRLEAKTDDMKLFYKLLMNNLYGKFGQRKFPDTYFCDNEELYEYLASDKLIPDIEMLETENEVYQVKITDDDDMMFYGSLTRLASYITASARVNLVKGMIEVGMDNVIYCDTDSIVTTKDLPEEMVGKELGKWKVEMKIDYGEFYCAKMYYMEGYSLEKKNNELIKIYKAKGCMDKEDCIKQIMESGKATINNKDVFVRKFGKVKIIDQVKHISGEMNKRKWIDENTSIPFENVEEYKSNNNL